MPATVIYDASVLYPNTLRDLLIRIAQAGMVRARWSEQILDEMLRALARDRPGIPAEKLAVLRNRMNAALRDVLVDGYEPITDGLDLPDKDDRHVLAAAIRCHASAIVTANLRDFPPASLAQWKVEPIPPDEFMLDLVDLDGKIVWACVQQIADSRRHPPETVDDVLNQLQRSGLVESVAALRNDR